MHLENMKRKEGEKGAKVKGRNSRQKWQIDRQTLGGNFGREIERGMEKMSDVGPEKCFPLLFPLGCCLALVRIFPFPHLPNMFALIPATPPPRSPPLTLMRQQTLALSNLLLWISGFEAQTFMAMHRT